MRNLENATGRQQRCSVLRLVSLYSVAMDQKWERSSHSYARAADHEKG